MQAIAALLLVLPWSSHAHVADSVTTFSRLAPGDELRIHFHGTAFVNNATFRVLFEGAPHPTLSMQRITSNHPRSQEPLPTRLRTVALADSEVAGLDSLLRFYRARRSGSCTTMDHVRVEQLRDGKVVGAEAFVDPSCAHGYIPGIGSLDRMVERISWKTMPPPR